MHNNSKTNFNYLNITKAINDHLKKHNIANGMVILQPLTSRVGVLVVDDKKVLKDLEKHLDYLFPNIVSCEEQKYIYNNLKNNLLGSSKNVTVFDSRLHLSLNEDIYLRKDDNVEEIDLLISPFPPLANVKSTVIKITND